MQRYESEVFVVFVDDNGDSDDGEGDSIVEWWRAGV